MKIDRVTLTKEEAGWFSRNVIKMKQLLEASESKNKGVTGRTTYKALASMEEKATEIKSILEAAPEDPYEIDLILSRKQKMVIKELVSSVHKTLTTRVIPEYERRGESHKDYLTNAKDKAVKLETLMRKFK